MHAALASQPCLLCQAAEPALGLLLLRQLRLGRLLPNLHTAGAARPGLRDAARLVPGDCAGHIREELDFGACLARLQSVERHHHAEAAAVAATAAAQSRHSRPAAMKFGVCVPPPLCVCLYCVDVWSKSGSSECREGIPLFLLRPVSPSLSKSLVHGTTSVYSRVQQPRLRLGIGLVLVLISSRRWADH